MSKGMSIWDLPTSPKDFRTWATRQKQACLQREKRAQATADAGYSSWPTPTASDAGNFPDIMIANGQMRLVSRLNTINGSGKQIGISTAARVWTHFWWVQKGLGLSQSPIPARCSPPVRVIFEHGPGSTLSTMICNPRFCEHLMGWPIGWTAPGQPVTEYAAWLRLSRGKLSSLLTDAAQPGRN
jgi:hypothetical protein